jgi:hypothetical protein
MNLVNKNTRYGVFDENDNLIIDYKYKSMAMDHMRALNDDVEFIMKELEYYKERG